MELLAGNPEYVVEVVRAIIKMGGSRLLLHHVFKERIWMQVYF
jgi:hypothetical protein